jgi:hypothetical protein
MQEFVESSSWSDTGMPSIKAICWDEIPAERLPAWPEPSKVVAALWPSPVNHDYCFAQDGFTQFADSDEQWDEEWRRVVHQLVNALGRFGRPQLRNGKDVLQYRKRGWWDRLIPWDPRTEAVELPPVDRVLLSARDDRLPHALVQFGEPPAATLRAGNGHPVLWVAAAPGVRIPGEDLAREVSEGRPVNRHQLRWNCLLWTWHASDSVGSPQRNPWWQFW